MLKHKKGVEFTLFGQVLIELLQDVLDKELPFRFVNFCLSCHVNTYLEAEELDVSVD